VDTVVKPPKKPVSSDALIKRACSVVGLAIKHAIWIVMYSVQPIKLVRSVNSGNGHLALYFPNCHRRSAPKQASMLKLNKRGAFTVMFVPNGPPIQASGTIAVEGVTAVATTQAKSPARASNIVTICSTRPTRWLVLMCLLSSVQEFRGENFSNRRLTYLFQGDKQEKLGYLYFFQLIRHNMKLSIRWEAPQAPPRRCNAKSWSTLPHSIPRR